MKNKISFIALIIAFLGITLLPACSRKMGCYYSLANEKPMSSQILITDVQICMEEVISVY